MTERTRHATMPISPTTLLRDREQISFNLNYAAAALVILVLAALASFGGLASYRASLQAAHTQVSTFSRLLQEQTSALFQSVELTLDGFEREQPLTLPPFDAEFIAHMRERVDDLAYVRALFVLDQQGQLIQDTDPQQSNPVVLADRSYFRAILTEPALDFFVAEPVLSRTEDVWSIPVLHRLIDESGEFAGLIGAAVEPRYLNAFYQELELGEEAAIALFDRQGNILALRASGSEGVDFNPRHFPVLAQVSGEKGTFVSSELDGTERIVGYRIVPDLPLGVAVAASLESIRLGWWRETWPTFLAVGCLIILVGWLTFVLDRRQRERENMARRTLETQKLEALGRMTGTIAHDFNNVLSAAGSSMRLIRRKGPTEEIMHATEQALERGENLVQQLLSFARRRDLEVREHELNGLIADMEHVLKHAAGPGNRLEIALGENLALCLADRTQFDAALVNLVVNARHAMPNGGIIRIATHADHPPQRAASALVPGSYVTVSVSDTGTGMDKATLGKIFEPFFTTKGEAGTGLGLAQIYGFMRQIGGMVDVESKLGEGTRFNLVFRATEAR